ncbi:hypothetical protein GPECTOR_42g833 [Gonium pectorale]|uniref:Exportin-1/Importin-beta-like domain-containing protein n=1 Tax=Gonium pectorale TaxID=33097 RepID=A0A150G9W2_GONPE|nr:hypothetical protein GPECTOR_42g833 [Gonium pectorale]|eukprot:KXZ46622.1 hypothetical protein GPECTOR_42g833 [Gonium pectorale]
MLLSGPLSAAAAAPVVLVDRLVLLAASASSLAGLDAAERLLTLAQEAAAAGRSALVAGEQAGGEALLRCALLILQLLAEEADGLDRARRQPLVAGGGPEGRAGMASRRGSVVVLVREVLAAAVGAGPSGHGAAAGTPGGGPRWPLLGGAVRCLGAWVRLEETGAGGCGVSPAELETLSPGLLPSLLQLLALPLPTGQGTAGSSGAAPQGQKDDAAAAATAAHQSVADVAVDIVGPSGRTSPAAAGGEAADATATTSAVHVLVQLGHQLAAAAAASTSAAPSNGGGGDAAVSALAAAVRVAVAVAERNPCGLATGPGEGSVELARMVVAAMASCPRRREVTESAIDYFLALNTVPTGERHASLGAPLYGALLPYMLSAVSYPADFVSWDEEVEEDEEAFNRFREQQATELLDSMYGQCRTALVTQLVAEATGASADGAAAAAAGGAAAAGSWQRTEAALFCLRAIHVPVKLAALGGWSGQEATPQAAAQAAELQALLSRLFADICSSGGCIAGRLTVPWVGLAVSRLVGDYAAWFGKAPDTPLQGALGLLLHLLAVPPAAAAAAQAFRNCCVRGADKLTAHPPTLSALASAAMAAVAPPPAASAAGGVGGGGAGAAAGPPGLGLAGSLSTEDRSAVVEGLARLAATLPAEAAAEAGCALMSPFVARVQSVAAAAAAEGGWLSPAALAALASELGLMTAVVRFLEPPAHGGLQGRWSGPGLAGAGHRDAAAAVVAAAAAEAATAAAASREHPVLKVLQTAWPVLSAVAAEPQCRADAGVVAALAELYKRSLLATKLAGRPLLPPLLSSLLGLLRSPPHHAAALEPLSTVVELFGELAHSGEARALEVAALEAAAQMMSALMTHLQQQQQAGAAPPSAPFPSPCSSSELAAAFFSLADRYLLFARELLLAAEGAALLPPLIEWACGVLTLMREREPAAAALSFVSHLLAAATRVTAEAAEAGAGGAASASNGAATPGELCLRLDAVLAAAGPRLVHALLVAGTDTCPRQLLRPLAGCLAGLTSLADAGAPRGGPAGGETAVRSGLPGWLRSAWGLPPLAELAQGGRLGDGAAHAARFTELLLRGHYPQPAAPGSGGAGAAPLSRGRLDSLVSDFFALARGEAAEDVMLAYEL